MRISHRWLTELLPNLDLAPSELAERLQRLGLLVEDVVRADQGLESVLVGRVIEVAPHPAADRLKVCRVAVDGGEPRQVVCGAPVVHEGALYALALPGARLPGGKAIEAAEIRGVRSEGMLCSAPELGLDHLGGAEGILELETTVARPGESAAPHLGLDDTVYVIEVFSNRPDWESHVGIARELQVEGGALRLPAPRPETEEGAPAPLGVRVADPEVCSYYSARVVRGVRVAPSPFAVRQRLWLLGVRPINNVVDATNWVMLERGTPLHAFDLSRLRGREVVVRRARAGERLVTLDGRERVLDHNVVVIADGDEAAALAGVIGGASSEVTAETSDVFLEAAHFDPVTTRIGAAALGVRTEASHRFGRGVDPAAVPAASRRGAELLEDWAGGRRAGPAVESRGRARSLLTLELRPRRVRELAALDTNAADAARVLSAVDVPAEVARDIVRVRVPSWRYDLEREVDLVEEVARRIGYDAVPSEPLPGEARVRPPGRAERAAALAERLRGLGLDEAYTTSFIDPAPFGEGFFTGHLVQPLNPLAQSESTLRPSLAPTLALAARYNLRRGAAGAALFEIGHVFERRDGNGGGVELPQTAVQGEELPALPGIRERRVVGLVLAGTPQGVHWSAGTPRVADFYDAKGIAEALLGRREVAVEPSSEAWLHPGQQAALTAGGERLGFVGRLHPRVERALDLEAAVVVAELELDAVLEPFAGPRFVAPSVFPRVERDLALIVPDAISAADVTQRIVSAGLAHLEETRIFDLYRGDQVPAGARSLAFRLVFRSPERTLTEGEVDREMARLVAALADVGLRQR